MKVPLVDVAGEVLSIRRELDHAIARTLDAGVFVGGPEVSAFERELATDIAVRHVVGTSSGTDALQAIGMALHIGPGDEIVTTPFTFFATAGAFARLGARVVFADIDEQTLTLDPERAADACTSRTKAVVTVDLFGQPAELPTVPCPVITDAAQAIRPGAARGLATALSFFPTKNLGAMGDAGAVLTNDTDLAEGVSLLRSQGSRTKHEHIVIGANFRIDALQAAILRVKLPHLSAWTRARRACAERYEALLTAAGLGEYLRLPPITSEHVFHHYVIRCASRDGLRTHLAANGIGTGVYYPLPLHLQPCFADLGYRSGMLPNTEAACQSVLALPMYPSLSAESQAYVVDHIAAFYRG